MPSLVSAVLREQIRLLKPLLTTASITASRNLQDALGELGAKAVAGKVEFTEFDIEGIPAAMASPEDLPAEDGRIVLYLHGGGYVAGNLRYARGFAGVLASKANVRVLCAAYRLAPEHPYPASLQDAQCAYDYLLELGYSPQQITLIGESAGGGLVFALCLSLKSEGLPLPARLIAISPWTDLTLSGGSYETNRQLDISLTRSEIEGFVKAYAPSDLKDPFVSPLFGELEGLPPCRIYVGSDELLLDDATRMAGRLTESGVPCTLTIADGMWHAYVLYGVPEANEALAEIKAFLEVRPNA